MKKNIVLAVLLCIATGCASIGVIPPDVSLVDLEFTDLTMFETTGEFTVRLANENQDPLRVTGGVFRLYLNGVKVGKALSSEPVEIPRLGTATHRVSLHINNVALATRLMGLMEQPTLDYEIKTKLFLDGALGTRRLNFVNSGSFNWDEAGAYGEEPLEEEPSESTEG